MPEAPSNETKLLCGLIGAGIRQSLTPAMHEEEARRLGLRLHYQSIDLERTEAGVEALPVLLDAAAMMGFAGLNITFPCKQAIVPLLDVLDDDASAMQAVNTVVLRNGRREGYNTDGAGWAWGFRRALPGADLSRVVLVGAGGAGSAIAHAAMRLLGANELVIVDRDTAKASSLAAAMQARFGAHRVHVEHDVARALHGASGVVHATPTGMAKHPGLPFPAARLHPSQWVSEAVYFPIETELTAAARAIGCRVCDGGHMAVGQALGAFALFTGRTPDAQRMEAHFRALIAARGG